MNKSLSLLSFLLLLILSNVNVSKSQTWQAVSNQPDASKYTGLYVSKSSSSLILTTLNEGIYRSNNGGQSWSHVLITNDTIFNLYALSEKILYAGAKGAVFSSLDSGRTWNKHSFPHNVVIGCMAFHPTGKLLVGTGSIWDYNNSLKGKGIWYSSDSAKTWQPLNNGISKVDPLVESITISKDGKVFAGIYDEIDFTNEPKLGVVFLDSFESNWQRTNMSVIDPSKFLYSDNNLKIEHIYSLNIFNNKIYASVSGVYVNYAVHFTVSKSLDDIKNTNIPWQVKWLKDSTGSNGSFFELITNLFQDSNGKQWASVSSSEFNSNEIYNGYLEADSAWKLQLDGLRKTVGYHLFGEDGKGNIYTTDYFLGKTLYRRPLKDIVSSVVDLSESKMQINVSPNPVKNHLKLVWQGHSLGLVNLKLMDHTGKLIFQNDSRIQEDYTMQLPSNTTNGIYFLLVSENNKIYKLRVVIDDSE